MYKIDFNTMNHTSDSIMKRQVQLEDRFISEDDSVAICNGCNRYYICKEKNGMAIYMDRFRIYTKCRTCRLRTPLVIYK